MADSLAATIELMVRRLEATKGEIGRLERQTDRLRSRQKSLEVTIATLKEEEGVAGELGAYAKMSVGAAILAFLNDYGPSNSRTMADGLLKGGITTESDNFRAVVFSTLKRLEDSDQVRPTKGKWERTRTVKSLSEFKEMSMGPSDPSNAERGAMPCDLCEAPSRKRQDQDETGIRDAVFVNCGRCGDYSITGIAAHTLRQLDPRPELQEKLRSWVRETGGKKRITTKVLASLS
ncbi:MAG: hypothetical protein OXI76_04830 [Gemmatimonadota bacterium]|nr:hypothetical protein [Gemmatimonadota bacterium]